MDFKTVLSRATTPRAKNTIEKRGLENLINNFSGTPEEVTDILEVVANNPRILNQKNQAGNTLLFSLLTKSISAQVEALDNDQIQAASIGEEDDNLAYKLFILGSDPRIANKDGSTLFSVKAVDHEEQEENSTAEPGQFAESGLIYPQWQRFTGVSPRNTSLWKLTLNPRLPLKKLYDTRMLSPIEKQREYGETLSSILEEKLSSSDSEKEGSEDGRSEQEFIMASSQRLKIDKGYVFLGDYLYKKGILTEAHLTAWYKLLFPEQSWQPLAERYNPKQYGQFIGAFQPWLNLFKGLYNTGNQYKSWWYITREFTSFILGVRTVMVSLLAILLALGLFVVNTAKACGASSWQAFGNELATNFANTASWLIQGLGNLVYGALQIVLYPLMLPRILLRGSITAYKGFKPLPENNGFKSIREEGNSLVSEKGIDEQNISSVQKIIIELRRKSAKAASRGQEGLRSDTCTTLLPALSQLDGTALVRSLMLLKSIDGKHQSPKKKPLSLKREKSSPSCL